MVAEKRLKAASIPIFPLTAGRILLNSTIFKKKQE
jgi:hypothetical protein